MRIPLSPEEHLDGRDCQLRRTGARAGVPPLELKLDYISKLPWNNNETTKALQACNKKHK
jgi:hypothetical protein